MTKDSRIWQADADGRTLRSVPTDVPERWTRRVSGIGETVYVSGEYRIIRRPYGKFGCSYQVKRQGVELFGFYARLTDAKSHAVKNARGEETVNVA